MLKYQAECMLNVFGIIESYETSLPMFHSETKRNETEKERK